MKRLTPPEQLVVLDAVMDAMIKLREHALAHGNAGAAQRLDEEHTSADESKQTLLWKLDAEDQQAYSALCKALRGGAKKKPAAKAKRRAPSRASGSGKRARSA